MTVTGLGLDVVGLAGFADQLDDRASGFVEATFTRAEVEAARRSATPTTIALAGRFAAKEAFVKAWSSSRFGLAPALDHAPLTDIEVTIDSFGRPGLRLHGAVADAFASSGVAAGGDPSIMVSITHDDPVAAAVVVISV